MNEGDNKSRVHWFEPLANFLGSAYLRYSFTYGTCNEVERLTDVLMLKKGDKVLDVGCGPGRHAHELARQGMKVTGIDISQSFIDLARKENSCKATFQRVDAREMPFKSEFDAVYSLCQGAFGLMGDPDSANVMGDPDEKILENMITALRPGGRIAMSVFSAYFQVRFLEDFDVFDVEKGVNCETTFLKNNEGEEKEAKLWTSCFTPRELRLMAKQLDLKVLGIWSVTPGDYRLRKPDLLSPEFLFVAEKLLN